MGSLSCKKKREWFFFLLLIWLLWDLCSLYCFNDFNTTCNIFLFCAGWQISVVYCRTWQNTLYKKLVFTVQAGKNKYSRAICMRRLDSFLFPMSGKFKEINVLQKQTLWRERTKGFKDSIEESGIRSAFRLVKNYHSICERLCPMLNFSVRNKTSEKSFQELTLRLQTKKSSSFPWK